MNTSPPIEETSSKSSPVTPRRVWLSATAIVVLLVGFGPTLYELLLFSFRTELFSHVVLVPFVTGYLIWIKRQPLVLDGSPNRLLALILLVLGASVLGLYAGLSRTGLRMEEQDRLFWRTLAFVLLFVGLAASLVDRRTIRRIGFPVAFLIFLVPLPIVWVDAIESFLQHRSASAAAAFFGAYGTPFFREQTYFQLPGINLEVAPECSGIRSSLALFITSIVAGYLFLQSPVKRAVLAFAVIPLAIVRNGFRVFVIGELCVHVGPEMIDSYIHRRGGPIFFALSLIPFFVLLWLLIKIEHRGRTISPEPRLTGPSI